MIETSRTTIRPYTEADIALIAPIFADPITMQFWPQPFSEDAAAAWEVVGSVARARAVVLVVTGGWPSLSGSRGVGGQDAGKGVLRRTRAAMRAPSSGWPMWNHGHHEHG